MTEEPERGPGGLDVLLGVATGLLAGVVGFVASLELEPHLPEPYRVGLPFSGAAGAFAIALLGALARGTFLARKRETSRGEMAVLGVAGGFLFLLLGLVLLALVFADLFD